MLPLPAQLVILFGVGALTGFINILAGGGSLLALPILIFLGLPAATANGTNRIAILIQNIAAAAGFHQLNVLPWRLSLLASIPAIAGAIVGANLAIDIPDALFKQILAGIMIAVLISISFDPSKRLRTNSKPLAGARVVLFLIGYFGIGLFGGFIQAGVGFLIISLMMLCGFDLVKTNAVKVLVTLIFTVAALIVFILHGEVNYLLGISLGLGSAAGGWLGTRFAVKKGHDWIRAFVVVMGVIFAVKLLWDSL
ncbi:MAG: TSUP family transporter [candidate division KSB1 bacterium]|nr:TSUP family transporter [candidate division KSB1 bacterium]MDZ7366940.1 TSUP family transporter [candidate division KSB1 bacterium]MDZ7406825.1 TSUP family transporter [candidate division KSB1 bacterium]